MCKDCTVCKGSERFVSIFINLRRICKDLSRIAGICKELGTEYAHEERICMDLKVFARICKDLQRFVWVRNDS
jgi:hypothetical protein